MNTIREIFERPAGQHYWVVRASGGDYVNHFRESGIMAIGHIDGLDLASERSGPFFPELKALQLSIEKSEKKESKGASEHRAYSRFNQVKTFIAEIGIGDLVVTIDHGNLCIGRVIGYPFLDSKPVRFFYDKKRDKFSEMPFRLRREVKWGPVMGRSTLPTAMKRSISARQTVFNIDKYWASIYHLLYPVFSYDECVYLSVQINQKEEINSFNVSQIFRVLTELEVVTRSNEALLANPNIDFDSLFNEFRASGDFNLKTIAEFMSPGSVWSHLGFSNKAGRGILISALLYGAIFGVDFKVFSIDGILDKGSRQKIVDYFLKRLDENDSAQMKQRLKLDMPNYNTKPLEDNANDAKPDNRALAMLNRYRDQS